MKKNSAHQSFFTGFISIISLGVIVLGFLFLSPPASFSMASMFTPEEITASQTITITKQKNTLQWEKYTGKNFWYYEITSDEKSIFRSRDANITSYTLSEEEILTEEFSIQVIKR